MSSRPRPAAVWTLLSILLAEFALVAGYTVFLVFELLVDRPDSLSSAIALTVVVAIAAIWVGAIVVGLLFFLLVLLLERLVARRPARAVRADYRRTS